MDTTNLYFSGNLPNPDYLAASGLALSSLTVIALAPLSGLASALDTLASQAFGASRFIDAGRLFN